MLFDEYQEFTKSCAVYPKKGSEGLYYTALGLCGEAGELANKIKKIMRDNHGYVSTEKRQELGKELGDAQWYISQLADELGFLLSEVAEKNVEKLTSRKERGTLQGDGDNR